MTVMLLTEHRLVFLILKGGCTGSSDSTLVKMAQLICKFESILFRLAMYMQNFNIHLVLDKFSCVEAHLTLTTDI